MQIPKPTDADRDAFSALVPDDPRVEVKPMFGNLGAFVTGNMFMGLFGSDVGVRLAEADAARLRADGGGPFGPAQRPMGGYVALPAAWHGEPARCEPWVQAALTHVSALPPRSPRSRAAAKPREPGAGVSGGGR